MRKVLYPTSSSILGKDGLFIRAAALHPPQENLRKIKYLNKSFC
jgi:hypothetical protein